MMRPALLLALTAAYTTVAAPFCTDSFETPSADWAPDGRYWSYSGTAANGGKSLMRVLYKGGKPDAPPLLFSRQNAIALPRPDFHLSLQAQLTPATPDVKLELLLAYLDAYGKTCGTAALPLHTEGSTFSANAFALTAPAGAKAVIPAFRISGGHTVTATTYVRFDDLIFGDGPLPQPEAAPIRLILPAAPDRLHEVSAPVPGTFPVKGGQQIHLSYCAKGGIKDTTVRSSLEAVWLNAAGNPVGTFATDLESPGLNYNYRNAAIADAPADAVAARLTVRLRSTRPQTGDVSATFCEFAVRQWQELLAEKRREHAQFQEKSQPIVLEPETKGKWTAGNLSIGKFYRYSRAPKKMIPDAGAGLFTDGTRLTDGEYNDGKDFQIDRCVAFDAGQPLAITIDLGAPQLVQQVIFSHYLSHTGSLIAPDSVKISICTPDSEEWTLWQDRQLPAYTNASGHVSSRIIGPGTMAKKIKFEFPAIATPRQRICFDEISVMGRIKNTWKYVPARGLYHGAFTPSYAFKEPLRGGRKKPMSLQTYEKLVGKSCSMVLWYQGMSPERRYTELAELRNNDLAENHRGFRFLCVGWLPPETTKLADIANGVYDEYFARYFRDSIDPALNLDNQTPVWFRPMNEFNTDWVNWGLDPVMFRHAWRRIFNIAEAVGATKQHIFVWSVNHLSYPDTDWNNMRNYYPGDQYVDWVGLSCYSGSLKYVGTAKEQLPAARAREVNEYYGHYKPMMVTEGGYGSGQDREGFVRQWFEFEDLLPNFKAMIWENHNDRCLQDVPTALEIYRKAVQSPYWIDNNTIQPR